MADSQRQGSLSTSKMSTRTELVDRDLGFEAPAPHSVADQSPPLRARYVAPETNPAALRCQPRQLQ